MPPIEETAPAVEETPAAQPAEVAPDAQTENPPAPEVTEPEAAQEPTEEPSPALPSDDPVPETPAVDPVSAAVVEAVAKAEAESPVPLPELAINTVAELVARVQEEFGITVSVKEIADDPAAVKLTAEIKEGTAERTAHCVVRNDDKVELISFYLSVCDAVTENKNQNRAANA